MREEGKVRVRGWRIDDSKNKWKLEWNEPLNVWRFLRHHHSPLHSHGTSVQEVLLTVTIFGPNPSQPGLTACRLNCFRTTPGEDPLPGIVVQERIS